MSHVEEDKFKHLKFRLPNIKTLAMLKMEKNFIAHIEKGYPRQPYADDKQTLKFLIRRIGEEYDKLMGAHGNGDLEGMKEECADISNIVDYLFEKLAQEEKLLEARKQ